MYIFLIIFFKLFAIISPILNFGLFVLEKVNKIIIKFMSILFLSGFYVFDKLSGLLIKK